MVASHIVIYPRICTLEDCEDRPTGGVWRHRLHVNENPPEMPESGSVIEDIGLYPESSANVGIDLT